MFKQSPKQGKIDTAPVAGGRAPLPPNYILGKSRPDARDPTCCLSIGRTTYHEEPVWMRQFRFQSYTNAKFLPGNKEYLGNFLIHIAAA